MKDLDKKELFRLAHRDARMTVSKWGNGKGGYAVAFASALKFYQELNRAVEAAATADTPLYAAVYNCCVVAYADAPWKMATIEAPLWETDLHFVSARTVGFMGHVMGINNIYPDVKLGSARDGVFSVYVKKIPEWATHKEYVRRATIRSFAQMLARP